eukprot:CAMPEP_0206461126 /NCGR_PEP_ID=MMETSP0324_2-20121206/25163_1 /ASSEMBLY_ACC=CAM_ASM_000836 /TAXON_ID=2866 /ORGANISM="Crypthecodinium cohnii, Strain Seligo" /LENGTH=307 /DNA_ID=CAMNT_0053932963 /DNA_START=202 /DNA_END=1125 /DNA_ORIENTATION=+
MAAEGEAEVEVPELKEVPPLTEEELEARVALFDEVFANIVTQDMKAKSIGERKENNLEDKALTYSEFDFALMNNIMTAIKTHKGPLFEKGIFLELGSGIGKACVAAALTHPFEKVVGVEILQGLSEVATASLTKYTEAQFPEEVPKPEVQLLKGDFVAEAQTLLDPLLPQVTVLLAVATFFGDKEMQALVGAARKMVDCSFVVTFSQPLPENFVVDKDRHPKQRMAAAVRKANSKPGVAPKKTEDIHVENPENDPDGFTLVHQETMAVPWSESATCYIYKKIPLDAPASEENPAEEGAEEAGAGEAE